MQDASSETPDRWLEERDQVEVGELTFAVVHCPGHSPGSVVFLNAAQRLAIVGDVLFAGSVGAPISLGAIRDNCSNRSTSPALGGRCCIIMTRADDDHRPRTGDQPFLSTRWPRLPVNAHGATPIGGT
jgi:hypothetical protein